MQPRPVNLASQIALFFIKLYRNILSNMILHSCRFYPTCSAYAEEAVTKQGLIRGLGLAAGRILRCHPFNKGGFDPLR